MSGVKVLYKFFNPPFFLQCSYAKIWGETKFQPREFPRSGSKEWESENQWLQWSVPVAWTNLQNRHFTPIKFKTKFDNSTRNWTELKVHGEERQSWLPGDPSGRNYVYIVLYCYCWNTSFMVLNWTHLGKYQSWLSLSIVEE